MFGPRKRDLEHARGTDVSVLASSLPLVSHGLSLGGIVVLYHQEICLRVRLPGLSLVYFGAC